MKKCCMILQLLDILFHRALKRKRLIVEERPEPIAKRTLPVQVKSKAEKQLVLSKYSQHWSAE